jgi:hypothetical protein
VIRFTTTLQRVTFAAEGLSADKLKLQLQGFLLWQVGEPLRAFSSLGVANQYSPPHDLRSNRHLLAAPQHKALQTMVGAEALAACASLTMEQALAHPEALTDELRTRLERFAKEIGMRIQTVELSRLEPADPELVRKLASPREEELRRAAALGHEDVEREIEARRAEREEAGSLHRAALLQRDAQARRDAALELLEVELRKPQAVREHELAMLRARKAGKALEQLREAKWVSVSGLSPLESLAGMIAAKN